MTMQPTFTDLPVCGPASATTRRTVFRARTGAALLSAVLVALVGMTGPGRADALLPPSAIAPCWNVKEIPERTKPVVITVAMELDSEARPIQRSIRLIAPRDPSAAHRHAFMAGRRAILRCGADGFDLPANRYDQWKKMRVTFDATKMVSR